MERRTAKERQEFAQMGGLVGGKARAARMSPEERSEAARKAVQERWRKHREAKAAEEEARREG